MRRSVACAGVLVQSAYLVVALGEGADVDLVELIRVVDDVMDGRASSRAR